MKIHHHVQDGGSTDGTITLLARHQALCLNSPQINYSFTFASEPDAGMYDAINRGWDRADTSWNWLGHLNADEQYQPGALGRVAHAALANPSWGAVTGNCIWVDEAGHYLCSRKPTIALPWVGRIWIPAFTCAFFIQRRYYGVDEVRFDPEWKSFGDKVFCRDLLNAGCRFGYVDDYLATFMHRGSNNLGHQPVTEIERQQYWNETLSPREHALAPLSILTAKISRVWRCVLGCRCRSYAWFDTEGSWQVRHVEHHRWRLMGA